MKTIKTTFLIILAAILLSAKTSDSRTNTSSFNIIQSDTKYADDFCKKAISEANWCGFRYKDKRNLIQFDTGLKVEFLSQSEINEDNSNCTLTDYRDFSKDIWQFTPEGKIIHLVPKQNKK